MTAKEKYDILIKRISLCQNREKCLELEQANDETSKTILMKLEMLKRKFKYPSKNIKSKFVDDETFYLMLIRHINEWMDKEEWEKYQNPIEKPTQPIRRTQPNYQKEKI